jgi:TetR/AcrR family transcriptional repressor of nem operon
LSEDMRQILNDGVHKLIQRLALLLKEGQQEGSIPNTSHALFLYRF